MEGSLLSYLAIIPLIVANIFWYSAKVFIKNQGLKSALFWFHFRDFVELRKLMRPEYSEDINRKAKIYYFGIPIVFIISLLLFFVLVG